MLHSNNTTHNISDQSGPSSGLAMTICTTGILASVVLPGLIGMKPRRAKSVASQISLLVCSAPQKYRQNLRQA